MNIMVTGGAGFIGSNLVDVIPQEHKVVILDNLLRRDESARNLEQIQRPYQFFEVDVRNVEAVKGLVKGLHIDLIYHLAALPSHRLALTKPPLEYVNVDLMGTLNVLDAAREYGARVVFASSNKVYGHQPIPFQEDMPMRPEGPYGQAKASAEDYCRQYAKYHSVSVVAIRFHHAVGPRCHSELVLPMFVEAALKGEPLKVNGRYTQMDDGGSNWRRSGWKWCAADFTNIYDVCNGLIGLLSYSPLWGDRPEFDVFNFGTGKMNTVLELAQMVLAETKSKSGIEQCEAMPHEGLEHLADVTKAKNVLEFEATVPLCESVSQYVHWRRAW